jgi:hypothetical protein
MSNEKYQSCIKACQACIVECEQCVTACLSEKDIKEMARCIQLDRDCSDICKLAVEMMARESEFAKQVCALCAVICKACGDECAKCSHMEHCKRCAETCLRCAEECQKMSKV